MIDSDGGFKSFQQFPPLKRSLSICKMASVKRVNISFPPEGQRFRRDIVVNTGNFVCQRIARLKIVSS
jgi:hypothetical protein